MWAVASAKRGVGLGIWGRDKRAKMNSQVRFDRAASMGGIRQGKNKGTHGGIATSPSRNTCEWNATRM